MESSKSNSNGIQEGDSSSSDDSSPSNMDHSTFTNEVIVIRPRPFYLNEEAAKDNKFIKKADMTQEELAEEVNLYLSLIRAGHE